MISLKTKGPSGFLSMLSFLSFSFTVLYYSGLGDKKGLLVLVLLWSAASGNFQIWHQSSPFLDNVASPTTEENSAMWRQDPRFSFVSLRGSVPESRCLSFNRIFSSSYWTVAMTLGWDRPLHGVSKWSSFISAFLICSGTLPSHQHFMLQLLRRWSLLSGNSK